MKKLSKIFLVLLALALVVSMLALPVYAEDGSGEGDTGAAAGTESTTATGTAATASDYKIGLIVLDKDGNPVTNSGAMSCLGGSVTLYIKHEYQIVAKYYNSKNETVDTEDKLILGIEDESGHVTLDGNTVHLASADDSYTFKVRIADPTNEAGETTYPITVQRFKFDFPDLIIAAIGVYVIVSAIRGTGSLFTIEFIKEDKKELFKKLTRILAGVTGLVFFGAAVLSCCFSFLDWVAVTRYVLFGIGALCLIAMIVVNYLFTDKEKKEKAQQTAGTGGGRASSAAFEFDGTEPTIDDVLEDLKKKENKNE